jgi:hypothetical protein
MVLYTAYTKTWKFPLNVNKFMKVLTSAVIVKDISNWAKLSA